MTSEPLLAVRGLSRRFGGLVALSELTFDVQKGEILSLIGPNGAGKTTAFNVIAGFLRASAGSVVFAGRRIDKLPPHARARLGLVRTFQQAAVFGEQTVLGSLITAQHLSRGPGIARQLLGTPAVRREHARRLERAREVASFCGLADDLETPALDLPYGVQKILNVAVALLAGPTALLLDEPVAGLNAVETAELCRLLEQINDDGTTVVLVEHDMKVVMGLSDRVVVLDHGVTIAEGTPEQVRSHPAVIKAYLGSYDVA